MFCLCNQKQDFREVEARGYTERKSAKKYPVLF